MENIQIENLLFFAKELVISLRSSTIKISLVESIGENLFEDILEYLQENREVSHEELELLKKYKATFRLLAEEIFPMECILLDIKEGKSHWHKPEVAFLTKLLECNLITEEESVRYLAHHNHFQQAIEICESNPELLQLAKKYGNERTRINFKNYETMKSLELRLKPLGKKLKREKI